MPIRIPPEVSGLTQDLTFYIDLSDFGLWVLDFGFGSFKTHPSTSSGLAFNIIFIAFNS